MQANEELVDAEFIQVMEQVASQMADEGQQGAADRLRNLAGQLRWAFAQAAETIDPQKGNRTETYLQLIDALLRCSSGEEVSQVLAANRELVDAGLVQTIEQVAATLAQRGDENAAAWLRNVAAQLSAGLGEAATTTPQEYLTFLQEALQAASENYGVLQATYPILERHQDKLDDTFATILQQWARSTFSQANPEEVEFLAGLIEILCIDIHQFPLGR